MSREPISSGMADLLMHLRGSVSAPADETRDVVPPLALETQIGTKLRTEPYTRPRKPRRPRGVLGLFAVCVPGETIDGRPGRFTVQALDYETSRAMWRTYTAQGIEATWHRHDRVPACSPDVVDVPDLGDLWRSRCTPREQTALPLSVTLPTSAHPREPDLT